MASSSLDTHTASSDAPECIEEVFTMEHPYDKLLRPRSLIRYYEHRSRLSRSNDPEEQLLQKIRDGASEQVLKSYLNTTLQNISDGGDVEIKGELASVSVDQQRNEGDKRCAKARALVYDKALGEAKDGTPIEEFLVKKLSKDEYLQEGGQCVDCSAVRWNLVNIVLALIRWRGAAEDGRILQKEVLLSIAVQYGHVELVKQLTKMRDVNINIDNEFWIFCKQGDIIRPNNIRLENHNHEPCSANSHVGSMTYILDLKPIDCAAGMGNVQMVMALLACDRIDVNEGSPLHWAVAMGHLDVVKELLNSKKPVDVNALKSIPLGVKHDIKKYNYVGFSPLHLASLFGHESVVKALCEDPTGRLRANMEDGSGRGITALQIATEMKHDEIVKTLLERPEVAKQVEGLYRDRQVHVDAANAILVGAALIASVTFAAWLQPPLGYSAFFGSASIEVGAPSPSGIYPSFVSVAGHPIMQIFWIFNSMSFFFAIATLMVGASAARPPKRGIFIGEVVRSLRASLSLAYILLTISVGCVVGAFASAGFLVLPPIPKYMVNMGVTVGIGVTVVFLAWTSSKVPYVGKVMENIVKKIIYWMIMTRITTKIFSPNLRYKLWTYSTDD
jgi:ankyrin repeat protein